MITLKELYKGCFDLIEDQANNYINVIIELGIEKTINDTQNNEIQDFGKYKDYFSNVYLEESGVKASDRLQMRKNIAEKVIEFFDCESPLHFKSTKYKSQNILKMMR